MQVYNDELYHYGKIGMKWSHHRAQVNLKRVDKARVNANDDGIKQINSEINKQKKIKDAGSKITKGLETVGKILATAKVANDFNKVKNGNKEIRKKGHDIVATTSDVLNKRAYNLRVNDIWNK